MAKDSGSVTGIYYGLDEPTLVQMRTDCLGALSALRQGKRFTQLSGGGKSFIKEHMSMPQLHTELAEISAALQRLNPMAYGRRVRRLVPDFSRNCL